MEQRGPWHRAIISTIRAASATAFAAEFLTLVVTLGVDRAPWRRLGLGWRFWMGLGGLSLALATACLIACLYAGPRFLHGDRKRDDARWCLWCNLTTIILSLLVPAVAAR